MGMKLIDLVNFIQNEMSTASGEENVYIDFNIGKSYTAVQAYVDDDGDLELVCNPFDIGCEESPDNIQ